MAKPVGFLVPVAVVAVVVGVGTAYYLLRPPVATGAPHGAGAESDALVRLKDYTRSLGGEKPMSVPAPGKMLPDVNTMTERLAARLEKTPNDLRGWRMLGWSYFNMGHYQRAVDAYTRAMALDPSSADLKAAYEEAKAKVQEEGATATVATAPPAAETQGAAQGATQGPGPGDGPPAARPPALGDNPAIRAMVDGLAARLEQSPRDADGWARLMRSRIVLGEKDVAETAMRRALEVFKDDAAERGKITAAATELGLKAE